MRYVIIGLVLLFAALLSVWLPRVIASRRAAPPAKVDANLAVRLGEAARDFKRGAISAQAVPGLSTAISELAVQCDALRVRAEADGAFARRNRASILRLLFPLFEVVRRSIQLAERGDGADGLLDASADAITRAAEALRQTADRADETALRHLEADLEILEERLPD